ncbi:MAG TPA: hypothetical protein VI934_01695 [Candidatus Nanoarchaeia archaeon]|nr:hypothetical protein [Candidatus Nanoarchaeia archaeon]
MNAGLSLVARIYDAVGPRVNVDKQNRTFEIVRPGLFFTNLTEMCYGLRGYRPIDRNYYFSSKTN